MVKHSFELKQYSNCFKLSIIGHEKPGTLDWRQVVSMTPDELDDLRRLLGVGMGDCDHCPAWKPYMESTMKRAQGENLISCDMMRFREQLDKLEEQIVSVQSKTNKTESHLNTMAASYGKRIESLELSRLAHTNRLGGLDKDLVEVANKVESVANNATYHLKRLEEGQFGLESTCKIRWGQIQDLTKDTKSEFDMLDKYLRDTASEQDIHSQHLTKIDALVSTMQSDLEILKLALVTINESNRKDAPDKPGSRGSKKN